MLRVIIVGAAGRDFHNFNVFFRNNPVYQVVAFTAAQIPNIDNRRYPPELCGAGYPEGIPIEPEEKLAELIQQYNVDEVVFAYSDVSYIHLMNIGSIANAAGAKFSLLGPAQTQIKSNKPVVAVCATRTGCGKSQTTRFVAGEIKKLGKQVAVIRHPMPYGDLVKQTWQRFGSLEDLKLHNCTIEEMEEYEPHINAGHLVFAGVDYARILQEAEKEADVILWDGGNNDFAFYKPDFYITVMDPFRPTHSHEYYAGETNVRLADYLIINKVDTADRNNINLVYEEIKKLNPKAQVQECESPVSVSDPELIKGKRVLIVEDGPTLTHGGMHLGAGYVAAKNLGVKEIIKPEPYCVGSIKQAYKKYQQISEILPALGYSELQLKELEESIANIPCDAVLIGTPIDLTRVIKIKQPTVRITYDLKETKPGDIINAIKKKLNF